MEFKRQWTLYFCRCTWEFKGLKKSNTCGHSDWNPNARVEFNQESHVKNADDLKNSHQKLIHVANLLWQQYNPGIKATKQLCYWSRGDLTVWTSTGSLQDWKHRTDSPFNSKLSLFTKSEWLWETSVRKETYFVLASSLVNLPLTHQRQCRGNSRFGKLFSLWQDNYHWFSSIHSNQKIKMEKVKEQHSNTEQLLMLYLGDEDNTTNIIRKLIKFTMWIYL